MKSMLRTAFAALILVSTSSVFAQKYEVARETQYFCNNCSINLQYRNCSFEVIYYSDGTVSRTPTQCGGCGPCVTQY